MSCSPGTGKDVMLVMLDASDQGIYQLMWVMNPDKLKGFAQSRNRWATTL